MRWPFLTRPVRNRLQASVVWAMVPLAALAGKPTARCVCADGQYELVCHAGIDVENLIPPQSSVSGSTSQDISSSHAGRTCCAQKLNSLFAGHGGPGTRVTGKSCCTPVVQAAALLALSAQSRPGSDHDDVGLDASALDSDSLSAGLWLRNLSRARLLERDAGPPPCDLVVTLGRLLI
jgi:hypothetical protein